MFPTIVSTPELCFVRITDSQFNRWSIEGTLGERGRLITRIIDDRIAFDTHRSLGRFDPRSYSRRACPEAEEVLEHQEEALHPPQCPSPPRTPSADNDTLESSDPSSLLLPFIANYLDLVRIIISSTARRRRRRRITSVEAKHWRANYFESNGKHLNRDKNFVPTSFVKYRAFERHKFSIESITVGSNERIFMVS